MTAVRSWNDVLTRPIDHWHELLMHPDSQYHKGFDVSGTGTFSVTSRFKLNVRRNKNIDGFDEERWPTQEAVEWLAEAWLRGQDPELRYERLATATIKGRTAAGETIVVITTEAVDR